MPNDFDVEDAYNDGYRFCNFNGELYEIKYTDMYEQGVFNYKLTKV